MARFSLLSGILTAISLIFGFILVYLFSTYGDLDDVIRKIGAGWTILNLVVTFVAAAAGFLLGASALGDIRKSGGTKDGLGFAVFAAVAWPILCLGLLVIILLKLPLPGGRSMGIPIALLLIGVPYLLAIFVLIRGLCRWARGVDKGDGQRHFPGLTRTVLATLGLACLGPVLASVVPILFPDPGFHDRFGAPGNPGRVISSIGGGRSEDGADWINGQPEITLSVQLEAGLRANFLLLQRNEKGGTTVTTIGQVNARSAETVTVKVGAQGDGGSSPELMATLHSSGQHFVASTGTDSSGWNFFADWTKGPVVSGADRQEFELAHRGRNKDDLSELLYLVVETTPLD